MKLELTWQQYRVAIKNFLTKRVSDNSVIDDLLQEILIKTHQNLTKIENHESIKAWLYQVANRVVIDYYRENAKIKNITQDNLWHNNDERNIYEELSACLLPFISVLPIESQTILTAIDIQGESQKSYAKKNNISYSTFKSQVQKSRNKLHALFEECCYFSLDNKGNLIDFEQKHNRCKLC